MRDQGEHRDAFEELLAAVPRTLTIFVRHQLRRDQELLLEAVGARWVIDPDAPSCAFGGGAGKGYSVCPECRELDRRRGIRSRAAAEYLRRRAADFRP